MQPSAFFPLHTRTLAAESLTAVQNIELDTSQPSRQRHTGLLQGLQHCRGVRFPSSRRFLWDRTPAGAQVLIDTKDHIPHVQLAGSAFIALRRAAEQNKASIPLQLGLSVTSTNQVTAVLQELDPLGSQETADHLRLECPLNSTQDIKFSLQDGFVAQMEQRNAARVQQLYVICASAENSAGGGCCSLHLRLLMPSCSFFATPLYTKRLCNVPLAEALLKPGKLQCPQTGYLSMDQARSLLPLEATDVNVYSTPLVGVWVKGPSSVMHPLVAAACLRFLHSSLLADRAVDPDTAAFLLLLCPEGDHVSKCYEVCPTEPQQLTLSSYHLQANIRQSAGVAQLPQGFMSADWVLDQQQPQPLPGFCATGQRSTDNHHGNCITPQSDRSGNTTSVGMLERLTDGLLQLPAPSEAAAAKSPILLHRNAHLPVAHKKSYLVRNSAPISGSAAAAPTAHQQYTAAAARRSLPAPGFASDFNPSAVSNTWSTPPESGAYAAGVVGAVHARSEATNTLSAVAGGKQSLSEPEPRSGLAARPYGSPPLQSWTASGLKGVAHNQQHRHQHTQPAREQWVQLGEQLLVEPSPQCLKPLCTPEVEDESTLTAAAEGDNKIQSTLRLHQQRTPQQYEYAMMDNVVDSTPLAESVPHKQQQEYAGMCKAGATCLAANMTRHNVDLEDRLQVNHIGQTSPSVQAKVALSNLVLLQHLSTGQLQQAVERVCSPTKTRSGNPGKAAGSGEEQADLLELDVQQQAASSIADQVGCCDAGQRSTQLVADGSDKAACYSAAKPQTPDNDAGSVLGGSVLMGSPAGDPTSHCSASASSMSQITTAVSSPTVRLLQLGTNSASAGAHAAAALQAATAAVQRPNPHPYARNLGVQRYAADAAVFSSQDHTQPSLSGWVGGPAAAAAAGVSHVSRSPSASGLPLSPALLPTTGTADHNCSLSTEQRSDNVDLQQSLDQSVGAVDRTVAALSVAGNMLHPCNAPDGVMCLQQQQHLFAPTVWQDPVAQALQVEVDRLRQELLQVQQLLRSAVMPNSEALALLPPPDEPQAAMPVDPSRAPLLASHQASTASELQHSSQQHQQLSSALSEMPSNNSAQFMGNPLHTTVQGTQAVPPAVSEQRSIDASSVYSKQAAAEEVVNGTAAPAAPCSQPPIEAKLQRHDSSSEGTAAEVAMTAAAPPEQQQLAVAQSSRDTIEPHCTSLELPQTAQQQQPHSQKQAVQQTARETTGNQQCQLQVVPQHSLSDTAVSTCQQDRGHCSLVLDASSSMAEAASKGNMSGTNESLGVSGPAAVDVPQPIIPSPASNSRPSCPEMPASSDSPQKPTETPSNDPETSPGVLASAVAVRQRHLGTLGNSVSASSTYSGLRSSLEVPPMIEVVRAKYCALDEDSDDSDREFEEKLMLKYGMKR